MMERALELAFSRRLQCKWRVPKRCSRSMLIDDQGLKSEILHRRSADPFFKRKICSACKNWLSWRARIRPDLFVELGIEDARHS